MPPNRKLFVNLPVGDLGRSIAFFSELGFGFEDGFTDETAACMRIGEDAYVMLLVKSRCAGFTGTQRCDPATQTEIVLGISAASRGAVDGLANTALRIGATSVGKTQDHGFMYSRSFQDPDGHHWEVVWMDQAAVAQALEDSTATG